ATRQSRYTTVAASRNAVATSFIRRSSRTLAGSSVVISTPPLFTVGAGPHGRAPQLTPAQCPGRSSCAARHPAQQDHPDRHAAATSYSGERTVRGPASRTEY